MKDIEVSNECKLLALEAISNAGSGHSGSVLSAGDMLYTLYTKHLIGSTKPSMFRDRFVLSNGHVSSVLYAILAGLKYFPVAELKNFRQFGAMLTGHPEVGINGVDASTGPLGQGVANAVGMAIAETILNKKFGISHYTYCMIGDGCYEEGVAQEALSLAGLYKLNKFILLYDKNTATLDGPTSMSLDEDVATKFTAMGYNVIQCNGHDIKEIDKAITTAKRSKDKPTIIISNTIIAKGSFLEGSHLSHGHVFKQDKLKEITQLLGVKKPYLGLSAQAKQHFAQVRKNMDIKLKQREDAFNKKAPKGSKLRALYQKFITNAFTYNLDELDKIDVVDKMSTRDANGKVFDCVANQVENMVSLCADLSSSTKVKINNGGTYSAKNRLGRNIPMGVREHAMGAIANGIALHGGLLPVCSTFLSFSNYMLPPIRMAAMMNLPVMFVFTHSSIYDTTDGGTHLPVEQLDQLRIIPNMMVVRPRDLSECKQIYSWLFEYKKPMCVSLSRGALPMYKLDNQMQNGAYFMYNINADANIMASGSEVNIAVAVKEMLKDKIKINVVSVPCLEIADEKANALINKIKTKPLFVIESSTGLKYLKYTTEDKIFNVKDFGVTGSTTDLINKYGYQATDIANKILKILSKK